MGDLAMYRIFVVDDEPIILSGITHLLDWNSIDCTITGCFRNGQEALNAIATTPVDVVITDIKMPVMDGLELVKACAKGHPEIAFVILSSLEEFRLVKEAIKYSVCEYMVKTELDASSMAMVMEKVKKEVDRRHALYKGVDERAGDGNPGLEGLLSNLMLMRQIEPSLVHRLSRKGLLDGHAMIGFLIEYPIGTLDTDWSVDDYKRLFEWQKDVVGKILASLFPDAVAVTPQVSRYCCLLYYVHGQDPALWKASLSRLGQRVAKASQMVTSLSPVLVSTAVHDGGGGLEECRHEMEARMTAFYLGKDAYDPSPLDLDGIYVRIEQSLKFKNVNAFSTCIRIMHEAVGKHDHSLSQAIFMLRALESAVRAGLGGAGLGDDKAISELFASVPFISRREAVLQMLDDVEAAVGEQVREVTGSPSSAMIDKAREYIIAHVEERISLADVASYAGVSPGYLSKSFKKVMGRSMVDYVNSLKVERAKAMMARSGGSQRISELALALGFDNIYYFSKVFKRVTGLSPSEWLKTQDQA